MDKKMFKSPGRLGHAGQILTIRKTIIDYIWDNTHIADITVYLIAEYLNGRRDDLRLYCVCSKLYFLSKLVYRGEGKVKKLDAKQYFHRVFEAFIEDHNDVHAALCLIDKQYEQLKPEENTHFYEDILNCFVLIATIWSHNLGCLHEQVYIPELAYAFEYVVKRKGNLPAPTFEGYGLFPKNYENYNYTEGIADFFSEMMISFF